MKETLPYTIQVNGHLIDLSIPRVMGILNITPDSFYAGSRKQEESEIRSRIEQILGEGADIIDIGAYSSRPNAVHISAQEEMSRLRKGLSVIRQINPEAMVSVDTFRADVAAMCVEEYGVSMINDISAGDMDAAMFQTVARLNVPYIMMHMQGTPQDMQNNPHYTDLMKEITLYFAPKVQQLHGLGVKDIVLDPGFGFGKTLEHNYQLLNQLDCLHLLQLPILVGVSRKSMIYKLLGGGAEEALNGTTVLHTLAMQKGASMLRVHDVKACVEAVRIVQKMKEQS